MKRLNVGEETFGGHPTPALTATYDITTKERMCLHAITFMKVVFALILSHLLAERFSGDAGAPVGILSSSRTSPSLLLEGFSARGSLEIPSRLCPFSKDRHQGSISSSL